MPHDRASGAKPAGPCCMVIFGAAGDLTKRLVVPSLYNLACAKLLPAEFAIVGVDLADHSDEDWRQSLEAMTAEFVKHGGEHETVNQDVWRWLTERMTYQKGDLNDPASYETLKAKLAEIDSKQGTGGDYLFYLAISDRFFGTVVQHLGQSE